MQIKNIVSGWGGRGSLMVATLAASAGVANAGLSQTILQVEVHSNGQTGMFEVPQSAGTWNGQHFTWNLTEPVHIRSSTTGQVLARVGEAHVFVIEDPVVEVFFSVASTQQNTSFTVTSPLLSFPTLNNAMGTASAAVSVTDLGGDGATLTPGNAGAFNAQYNGQAPFGTPFADLLGLPVVAPAFSTVTASEEFPGGGGMVPIAAALDDISARWDFTLSPGDLASGTGVFTVIPAPAGLAVLGVAGLGLARRRR